MKSLILTLTAFLIAVLYANAQEINPAMENAIKICTDLSNSIDPGSVAGLRAANNELKKADIVDFGDIWLEKGKELNLDGHFLFDEVFVDSLIVNRKTKDLSKKYAKMRSMRGSTGKKGRIKMTTRALKAGQSCVWKTVNRNDAEFALVAEPLGLFTMTIRNEDGKILYAETKKNKIGDSMRKARILLPDKTTKIFIEVKNCGKHDASFALLKN